MGARLIAKLDADMLVEMIGKLDGTTIHGWLTKYSTEDLGFLCESLSAAQLRVWFRRLTHEQVYTLLCNLEPATMYLIRHQVIKSGLLSIALVNKMAMGEG